MTDKLQAADMTILSARLPRQDHRDPQDEGDAVPESTGGVITRLLMSPRQGEVAS
jgi:hypothetical protein